MNLQKAKKEVKRIFKKQAREHDRKQSSQPTYFTLKICDGLSEAERSEVIVYFSKLVRAHAVDRLRKGNVPESWIPVMLQNIAIADEMIEQNTK